MFVSSFEDLTSIFCLTAHGNNQFSRMNFFLCRIAIERNGVYYEILVIHLYLYNDSEWLINFLDIILLDMKKKNAYSSKSISSLKYSHIYFICGSFTKYLFKVFIYVIGCRNQVIIFQIYINFYLTFLSSILVALAIYLVYIL